MGIFERLRPTRKGREGEKARPRRRRRPSRRARGLELETLPGGDSARDAERATPERAAELAD
jgi:hypothetical protein